MAGGIHISLHGDEELIARLLRMEDRGRKLFTEALEDCTDHVRNRAVEGIANGPKTGRIYTTYFWTAGRGPDRILMRGRQRPRPHQASARGEYPAADTGNLMRTIWDEVEAKMAALSLTSGDLAFDGALLQGYVGADAAYAVHLEYKAPEEGGRPFLRKALAQSEDFIRQRFMELRGRIVD